MQKYAAITLIKVVVSSEMKFWATCMPQKFPHHIKIQLRKSENLIAIYFGTFRFKKNRNYKLISSVFMWLYKFAECLTLLKLSLGNLLKQFLVKLPLVLSCLKRYWRGHSPKRSIWHKGWPTLWVHSRVSKSTCE